MVKANAVVAYNGNQELKNGKRAVWVSLPNATTTTARAAPPLPSTTTFADAMIRTRIYVRIAKAIVIAPTLPTKH